MPLFDWRSQPINPKDRYLDLARRYGRMALQHLICGCHIHVGVEDRDLVVQIMNRAQPWLPVLLALSASSRFWMGEDTGYASYRSVIWARWPIAGPPPEFRSFEEYSQAVQSLIQNKTIQEPGQAFWDVRPGTEQKTVEFRIADSCTTVDETIVQAGLSRGLVQVCLEEISDGIPAAEIRPELIRAAKWRASRFGLDGTLLDPFSGRLVPASDMVDRLLERVRGPLDSVGDWEEVAALARRTVSEGSSSIRQRKAFEAGKGLAGVVDLLVEETGRR